MERVFLLAVSGILAGDGMKRPGEVFPAEAETAAELLDLGAARPAEPDEVPLDQLEPLADPRLRAIEAILPGLGAEDFTAAGTPRVDALRSRLGFIPTAEETAQFKRPA